MVIIFLVIGILILCLITDVTQSPPDSFCPCCTLLIHPCDVFLDSMRVTGLGLG